MSECNFDKLPAEVVSKAKLIILDTIGAMLAGTRADSPRIVRKVVMAKGGRPESTIIGFGDKAPCIDAGLVMGTMAHCMELDDGHRPSDNHVAGVIVSASLPAAEYANASGKELLTAVVLGYDIMGKIGEAVLLPRDPTYHLFHGTGICGPFGAAASAGKLIGLTEEQLVNSFGIAGTQGAGLTEVRVGGTHGKAFHVGKAVESGLMATFLARGGLTGPATIIEGQRGFCLAFSTQPRPEKSVEALGVIYEVMRGTFKAYSCPGTLGSGIYSTLKLVSDNSIDPKEVEKVKVGVTAKEANSSTKNNSNPKNQGEALESYPYAIAVTLLDRATLPKQYSNERITSPDVKDMLKRIEFVPDAVAEKNAKDHLSDPDYVPMATVIISTKDGKDYQYSTDRPKGYSIKNQFSEEDVKDKFRNVVGGILEPSEIERAINVILNLEHLSNMRDLVDSLIF